MSQEHNEWYRTSEDKKRNMLVTNLDEGSSPIANLPDLIIRPAATTRKASTHVTVIQNSEDTPDSVTRQTGGNRGSGFPLAEKKEAQPVEARTWTLPLPAASNRPLSPDRTA
jgi:hypothetical protein